MESDVKVADGPRRVLALTATELLLTTVLMAVVVGLVRWGIGTMNLEGDTVGPVPRVAVVGGLSGVFIAVLILSRPGRFSGAHVNPAITVSLWAFGIVPGRRVVPYLAAQAAGSVLGTAVGVALWGQAAREAPTAYAVIQPAAGWSEPIVFAVEAATMAVIVGVMCWVLRRRPGWPLPWVIGAMIGVQAAVFGTVTGGVANPARQLGPALLSGQTHVLVTYLVAPIVGGVAAAIVARRRLTANAPAPSVPVHVDIAVDADPSGDESGLSHQIRPSLSQTTINSP